MESWQNKRRQIPWVSFTEKEGVFLSKCYTRARVFAYVHGHACASGGGRGHRFRYRIRLALPQLSCMKRSREHSFRLLRSCARRINCVFSATLLKSPLPYLLPSRRPRYRYLRDAQASTDIP